MITNQTEEELRNQGYKTLSEILKRLEATSDAKIDIQALIKIRETISVKPNFKGNHTYYCQEDQEKIMLEYMVKYNGDS